MDQTIKDIAATLSHAGASDLALLVLLGLGSVVLHLLNQRFVGKGVAAVFSVGKWVLALAVVRVADSRMFLGSLDAPVVALYCLFTWQAFRALLLDVYGGLYLTRIQKKTPNRLFNSLFSLLAAVVIAGIGLRGVFDVDVSSILTSSAILTAVVGFSLQDTIGSLFSGLLIQTEKPFKLGDWIKVGDIEGQVTEISWRYTKLQTIARSLVLIPNNVIAKERVLNLCEPIPEVSVPVSVPTPVDTPPVKVKSALEEALRKSPLVCKDPPPRVRLVEIGLDQVQYRVFFFVRDYADAFLAKSELLSAIWYEFKKQGIDFPAPRMNLLRASKDSCLVVKDMAGVIASIGMFEGLSREDLELLVQCSAVRTFAPGVVVMEHGRPGTTMFIIVSGSVSVSVGGKELSVLGPGEIFGEMALLTGLPRQADVTAIEPATCLEVDREAFRGVMDKAPVLVANVNRVFREREASIMRSPGMGSDSADGLFDMFRRIFW